VENLRKYLFIAGIGLIVIAVLWPWLAKLNVGKLPGDILIKRGQTTFYFPIVTSVIASIVLSIILWLIRK